MITDKNWQPSASLKEIKRRSSILCSIRTYFINNNVMEIESPIISSSANVDPYIESFITDFNVDQNNINYYLHTSPEFFMKRLLAYGCGDIYSLGKVFRNCELGAKHNPEFTMLEWYRLNWNHHQLMNEVNILLNTVYNDLQISYQQCEKISYKNFFLDFFKIDPHKAKLNELLPLVNKYIDVDVYNLNKNDCLDLLLDYLIKLKFYNKSIFIYNYPTSMVALSKIILDSGQEVAARFELFVNGIELANGYYELTNEKEQQTRFEDSQYTRIKQGKKMYPYDQLLVSALKSGLPVCSGVSIGIDRLHMIIADANNISDIINFDFNCV